LALGLSDDPGPAHSIPFSTFPDFEKQLFHLGNNQFLPDSKFNERDASRQACVPLGTGQFAKANSM
jgi:hypothetical protein